MSNYAWDDIVDSVQLDKVLDELGINVTSVIRGEHWASCQLPTHPSADARPSFSINEDTLLWNCFTCNEGGLLPSLVIQMLGFEGDDSQSAWSQAIEWLLPFSDADVESDEGFQQQLDRYLERATEETRRTRSVKMPYFSSRALDKYDPCPIELLEKWHIFDEGTVDKFHLKYDPEHRRKETDYYGPCIIIPHYWQNQLVGYQERWLDPDRPKWIGKYTNSDDFPKAQTLFGWDLALLSLHFNEGDQTFVVESAMTVARLWEIGFTAVGTFGASVTDKQCSLLATLQWGIILARDEDPDYVNEKGRVVKGAGVKNYGDNLERLSYKIPTWTLPPISKAKGDLADLDDDEVFDLYERAKPVFRVESDT